MSPKQFLAECFCFIVRLVPSIKLFQFYQETEPRFSQPQHSTAVPGEAEQCGHVAGEVEHLGALLTAQQVPPVLAHSTPVLVGVVVLVGALSRGARRAVHEAARWRLAVHQAVP